VLQGFAPDRLHIDHTIRNVLEDIQESFHDHIERQEDGTSIVVPKVSSSEGSLIFFWWKIFMVLLLSSFFLTCISHFAQYYQLILDRNDSELLRKRLHHKDRQQLTSPSSGRLKLPPPTPRKASQLTEDRDHTEESSTEKDS
jgi:hypothetical protein